MHGMKVSFGVACLAVGLLAGCKDKQAPANHATPPAAPAAGQVQVSPPPPSEEEVLPDPPVGEEEPIPEEVAAPVQGNDAPPKTD